MPAINIPEPKRRFVPSKWEAQKIAYLVKAIRKGWIKLDEVSHLCSVSLRSSLLTCFLSLSFLCVFHPSSSAKEPTDKKPKYYEIWTDEEPELTRRQV